MERGKEVQAVTFPTCLDFPLLTTQADEGTNNKHYDDGTDNNVLQHATPPQWLLVMSKPWGGLCTPIDCKPLG